MAQYYSGFELMYKLKFYQSLIGCFNQYWKNCDKVNGNPKMTNTEAYSLSAMN